MERIEFKIKSIEKGADKNNITFFFSQEGPLLYIHTNLFHKVIYVVIRLKDGSIIRTMIFIEIIERKNKPLKATLKIKKAYNLYPTNSFFCRFFQSIPEKIGDFSSILGRIHIYNRVSLNTSFLIPQGFFLEGEDPTSSIPNLVSKKLYSYIIKEFFERKDWYFFYNEKTYIKKEKEFIEIKYL